VFRVKGLGYMVQGSRFKVKCPEDIGQGLGFRVKGLGFMV
jgi:hypothetical protein